MRQRALLSDRLPRALHLRLENWGAVMRERMQPATSPTYDVCQALARRAGQGYWDGWEGGAAPEAAELDVEDAQWIEGAWRGACYRILHQHRSLLRAHYVERAHRPLVCRLLGLRYRSYEDELVAAVGAFERFLALYAMRVHNPRQDNPTTV